MLASTQQNRDPSRCSLKFFYDLNSNSQVKVFKEQGTEET